MARIDMDGLTRTYMTLGQIHVALSSHIEDAAAAEIDPQDLEEAREAIEQGQSAVLQYLHGLDERFWAATRGNDGDT